LASSVGCQVKGTTSALVLPRAWDHLFAIDRTTWLALCQLWDHPGVASAVLEHPLPWTKMRQVYRLLGLVRRHGAEAVDDACRRALDAEVIHVGLIERILARGGGEQLPLIPKPPSPSAKSAILTPGRFTTSANSPKARHRQSRYVPPEPASRRHLMKSREFTGNPPYSFPSYSPPGK
jgi:hypothetical protein